MSEKKLRVISGAVLAVLLGLLAWAGGFFLLAACAAVSFFGMKEFYDAAGMKTLSLQIAAIVLLVLSYAGLYFGGLAAVTASAAGALLVFCCIQIFSFPSVKTGETVLGLGGFLYAGLLPQFLYLCREMTGGVWIFCFVFLCSWLGDTGAYEIGRRFGKHKMAPLLSPGKSWEGLGGGVLTVTLCGFLFGLLLRKQLILYSHPVLLCTLAALAGCLISVCGDLFASAVKREFGIKDYGKLIPGHGGILDRFDSVLFAAPFVFFVFYFSLFL